MVEYFSSIDRVERSPDLLLDSDEVIVVVDDSKEAALLLTTLLENRHLPVICTGSAESLQTILSERNAALVILDLELPGQDGSDILPELVQNYPDLGIIMVTGSDAAP